MKNKITFNALMLYLMTFAKMVFPLVTLPYLTRILSVENYAVVSYVKAAMVYAQIFVDFGFIMSATKDIALLGENKDGISKIVCNVIVAKMILVIVGGLPLFIAASLIDVLSNNVLYLILSYVGVSLTILLPDFLFRGIQEMQSITIRFVIARGVSTALTFLVIKSDCDLLYVPILDIVGVLCSALWTWKKIYSLGYCVKLPSLIESVKTLKNSFVFFISDATAAVFGAFNTLLVGIFLPLKDVSYWSVAMQLISAVQALYAPINSSLFPHMVKEKDLRLVLNVFKKLMPLVCLGTALAFVLSEKIVVLVAGVDYLMAARVFDYLLPLLVISFPAMLFGWPCLGAINKEKQTTITTVSAAVLQILIIIFFVFVGRMSLYSLAIARIFSELLLMASRVYLCYKYRNLFNKGYS